MGVLLIVDEVVGGNIAVAGWFGVSVVGVVLGGVGRDY